MVLNLVEMRGVEPLSEREAHNAFSERSLCFISHKKVYTNKGLLCHLDKVSRSAAENKRYSILT